jgi:hypothetical protein
MLCRNETHAIPVLILGRRVVTDPDAIKSSSGKATEKGNGLSQDLAEPVFFPLVLIYELLWARSLYEASPKVKCRLYGLGLGAGFFAGALVPVPAPSAFRLSRARASCVLNG